MPLRMDSRINGIAAAILVKNMTPIMVPTTSSPTVLQDLSRSPVLICGLWRVIWSTVMTMVTTISIMAPRQPMRISERKIQSASSCA